MRETYDGQRPLPLDAYSIDDLGLTDSTAQPGFDAITRLAARIFSVPVSLVSVIDDNRDVQCFPSQIGLQEPLATERSTPLSHSFCLHVKRSNAPLVVPYALDHPVVRNNPAILAMNVVAYLGVPIATPDGNPIGALCVISGKERHWSDNDIATLEDLANCVSGEIALRASLLKQSEQNLQLTRQNRRTQRYNAMREKITNAFMRPGKPAEKRFQAVLAAGCDALNMDWARICRADGYKVETQFKINRALCGDGVDGLSGALSAYVMTGQELVCMPDVHDMLGRTHCNNGRPFPGSFIGAPLILDGAIYGTIEFCHPHVRKRDWTEEETSMINIIAMFICGHLGLFGQIEALRQSEAALASYVADIQSRDRSSRLG